MQIIEPKAKDLRNSVDWQHNEQPHKKSYDETTLPTPESRPYKYAKKAASNNALNRSPTSSPTPRRFHIEDFGDWKHLTEDLSQETMAEIKGVMQDQR
jgi:hypothetical protein